MPFLHGFDFYALAGFDDFAVSLYVKEFVCAVGHGKAGLTHGPQERLGCTDVTDGDYLHIFGRGGGCFQVGLEHGRPAFGEERYQVLACCNRDDKRYDCIAEDE